LNGAAELPAVNLKEPLKVAQVRMYAALGGGFDETMPKKYELASWPEALERIKDGIKLNVTFELAAVAEDGPVLPRPPLVTTHTCLFV